MNPQGLLKILNGLGSNKNFWMDIALVFKNFKNIKKKERLRHFYTFNFLL